MALAQHGANVAFTYLKNSEAANIVLNESKNLKGKVKAYQADIKDQQQIKKVISEVALDWGGIDVAINNAGIRQDKTLAFMSAESWNEVLDTNLTGLFI